MLYLYCPTCERYCDETELTAGGEAHLTRKDVKSNNGEFHDYLYARKNHKGVIFERWRHAFGCGKWFHVSRCSINNQVFGSYSIRETSPPKTLLAKIKRLRVDFKGWTK